MKLVHLERTAWLRVCLNHLDIESFAKPCSYTFKVPPQSVCSAFYPMSPVSGDDPNVLEVSLFFRGDTDREATEEFELLAFRPGQDIVPSLETGRFNVQPLGDLYWEEQGVPLFLFRRTAVSKIAIPSRK